MHRTAWVLQVVLGVYFVVYGVVHLVLPEGLPQVLDWMYDLPTWAHWVSGVAEILGGLGLILPGATRILPALTQLAASGLIVVMVLAAVWHITRGEVASLVGNVALAALLAFVAYVRARVHPLTRSSQPSEPQWSPPV